MRKNTAGTGNVLRRWRISHQESGEGAEKGLDWTVVRVLLKKHQKSRLACRMHAQRAIKRAGYGEDAFCSHFAPASLKHVLHESAYWHSVDDSCCSPVLLALQSDILLQDYGRSKWSTWSLISSEKRQLTILGTATRSLQIGTFLSLMVRRRPSSTCWKSAQGRWASVRTPKQLAFARFEKEEIPGLPGEQLRPFWSKSHLPERGTNRGSALPNGGLGSSIKWQMSCVVLLLCMLFLKCMLTGFTIHRTVRSRFVFFAKRCQHLSSLRNQRPKVLGLSVLITQGTQWTSNLPRTQALTSALSRVPRWVMCGAFLRSTSPASASNVSGGASCGSSRGTSLTGSLSLLLCLVQIGKLPFPRRS